MRPFAELLTEYMERINISDAGLAHSIGVRRQTIFRWRQGIVEKPRHRDNVLQCAQALGLTHGERDGLLEAAGFSPERDLLDVLPPFPDSEPSGTDHPFVARQAELAQLNAFLEETRAGLSACGHAQAGHGQVAFVTGDAGSGKTELVREFARRAQETHADLIVAGGNCNAYTGVGDPYLPFREILELLSGDVEVRWAATAIGRDYIHRVWALLPHVVQTLVNVGPDLVDVFVPAPALLQRATTAAPGDVGWLAELEALVARTEAGQHPANVEQHDLFEQYTRVMQSLARQRPLLLVLDDLQWADAGSISLLFHLGRQIQSSRILIVGLYRPAEVALGRNGHRHPLEPLVNEFQRRFGDCQVDLRTADGREFVQRLLDTEPHRLDGAFLDALHRHTGGNALFTVEMLRGMQERGDLVRDEAGRWANGSPVDWETLPARVEGVIGERIGRLSPKLQEILKVASVEGERFTAEVVARVQGDSEQATVQRLSGELDSRHHLVRWQNNGRFGAQRSCQYRFRHILFQKHLYNSLDAAERAYLHENVGNALEMLYGTQTEEIAAIAAVAGQLARHFREAGDADRAINHLLQAGKRAVRLSANEEAIAHLAQGLALLETLSNTPERTQRELDLQVTLGPALMASKGYAAPEVVQAYARARELCQEMGEATQLFPVVRGLWAFYFTRAEHQTACELGERLLVLAEKAQDPALLLEAHRILGTSSFQIGEFALARMHLERAIALYDPQQHSPHAFMYGQDPGVSGCCYAAFTLWLLGYPDQARKRSREALELAQQLPHAYTQVYGIGLTAKLHKCCRDVHAVQELAETTIALAAEDGFPFFLALGIMLRGWTLVEQARQSGRQRQAEEGLEQIRHGLASWRATGAELSLPAHLALLAEAYRAVGQVEEGLSALAEALARVERTGDRYWEAELYRLKGELLRIKAEAKAEAGACFRDAEACFQHAIEVARRQQAKSLELRAAVSLCRLWQKQGRGEEGRQMLADIYGWFTEGFDTADLKEAEALLQQLAA
ncbi:MAG: hypothetical protein MAG451_01695 [Anaerolineales bacterium]|nr:hypothetical protein [Anaerolineales bacterium]